MNFMPVLIMSSILASVTVLLAIADKLLINYGECKIKLTKDDEEMEFVVEGGDSLLHALQANGIEIAASCGGKATCGFCKVRVRSGGGEILPTEEIFMNREEKASGVRLSCQVKVKQDIEIFIPDYLTTVRDIVKNKMFDRKMKWQFVRTKLAHVLPSGKVVPFTEEDESKTCKLLENHEVTEGSLVPMLQAVNSQFNYLPEAIFPLVSRRLQIPVSRVYRVATFYNAFSLTPKGRNTIAVCLGTACVVKGADNVLAAIERELGITSGETTEDMAFSIDAVRCIGCCGLAPVLTVGEDVHGLMTAKKVQKVLEIYQGGPEHAKAIS